MQFAFVKNYEPAAIGYTVKSYGKGGTKLRDCKGFVTKRREGLGDCQPMGESLRRKMNAALPSFVTLKDAK